MVEKQGEKKTLEFFEEGVEGMLKTMLNKYSRILVTMRYDDNVGTASWWSAMNTLIVNVGNWGNVLGSIEGAIEHEMMHFSTDILAKAFHGISLFGEREFPDIPGLPPMNIRTPEYKQPQKNRYDPDSEFTIRELHALDDVEFFTEIRDALERFGVKHMSRVPPKERVDQFIQRDVFFQALKRAPSARKKYELAKNEFYEGVGL